VSLAVLCPTLLPRPLLGWPGQAASGTRGRPHRPRLTSATAPPWEGSGVEPHLAEPTLLLPPLRRSARATRAAPSRLDTSGRPAPHPGRDRRPTSPRRRKALPRRLLREPRPLLLSPPRRRLRRDPAHLRNRATTALLGLLLEHLRPVDELEPTWRSRVGQTLRTGRAGTQGVALSAGAVWTANDGDVLHGLNALAGRFVRPALVRIDPSSGRVAARIDVGSHPRDVTVAGDAGEPLGAPRPRARCA
jgi:hypothetical protein